MSEEIFTTSIILQALPDHFNQICHDLRQLPETHFGHLERETGKIIVLLETDSMQAIQDWISRAHALKGILNVTMVYQHAETKSSLNEVIS